MATTAKIKDRMAEDAPHTLDGMAFMPYATYNDEWGTMDLSEDYRRYPLAAGERQRLSCDR